jgi:hypothetical protein
VRFSDGEQFRPEQPFAIITESLVPTADFNEKIASKNNTAGIDEIVQGDGPRAMSHVSVLVALLVDRLSFSAAFIDVHRVAEHKSSVSIELPDNGFKVMWRHDIVLTQIHNIGSVRQADAMIPCLGEADVLRIIHHTDVCVLGGVLAHESEAAVMGAVVGDDDLNVRQCLRQTGVKRLPQKAFTVIDWNIDTCNDGRVHRNTGEPSSKGIRNYAILSK